MKKVLIVDDQVDLFKLLEVVLKKADRILLQAQTGEEALALALNETPDLILLDVMLPGRMDGYEVARTVKSNPLIADCPVIIMTAKVQEKDRADAYAAGADDYIGKPFRIEILREKVARFIGSDLH
jgi:DNA-binding response OmpR family regulator